MAISEDKLADIRTKNLEMIQAIVVRMAGYSASLKNYCITLTTALAGFSITSKHTEVLFLAALPIIIFCLLDTHYLRLERRFRCLFDVRRQEDWSTMPTFEISLKDIPQASFIRTCLSWSIVWFYAPLAAAWIAAIGVVERLNV